MPQPLAVSARCVPAALAVLLAAGAMGCDALILVDGWVVESQGPKSGYTPYASPPPKPERLLEAAGIEIELWSPDRKYKLCTSRAWQGKFDAGYTGWPYRQMLLRVRAPGYLPLETEIPVAPRTRTYEGDYGIIALVPKPKPETPPVAP